MYSSTAKVVWPCNEECKKLRNTTKREENKNEKKELDFMGTRIELLQIRVFPMSGYKKSGKKKGRRNASLLQ
jgi:hypothetical protein